MTRRITTQKQETPETIRTKIDKYKALREQIENEYGKSDAKEALYRIDQKIKGAVSKLAKIEMENM